MNLYFRICGVSLERIFDKEYKKIVEAFNDIFTITFLISCIFAFLMV